MKYTVAVVTISDKGSRGEREDLSGPVVCAVLETADFEVTYTSIIPDERMEIEAQLIMLAERGMALVVTTGGTGFAPRDVTPEATIAVCDRLTPGIPEAMRAASLRITPNGMLSRQAAGLRGRTLIVNVPGSPKAARENLEAVMGALGHAMQMLRGSTEHSGT